MNTFAEKDLTGMKQMKTQILPAPEISQYTLGQIIGIWALVSLPMAVLFWVVLPIIMPYVPLHPGITAWLLIIVGMIWEFVVALAILYRELGTLRWSAVRQRLWLQTPRDPKTDQPNRKLYWWVLPLIILDVLGIVFSGYLDAPMTWLFPALKEPEFMDLQQLVSPQYVGQWWLLGVALVSCLFNYFLGEAFLFHGILLPKMQGVFGKYDWVANAVIFGFYHVHKPWALPTIILTNMLYSWPASRFRSSWMAVIVHGIEGLPVIIMPLAVILGLVG